MSLPVNVVITYLALPGMADVAREELAALIETVVAKEPACQGIQLFQGSGDPHRLLLTEQWDSEEAYRGPHMQTAHLTAFRARAAEFLAGPPEITYWHTVGVAGIRLRGSRSFASLRMTPRTERERMLAGEYYDPRDAELLALAHRTRALVARYNASISTDAAGRRALIEEIFGAVSDEVWIEPPFFCEYGVHVSIGARTFINVNSVFLDSAPIRIGADVLVGPGVQLLTARHPLKAGERIIRDRSRAPGAAPYRTDAAPIAIGNGVWIGAGTIVLPGVTIGDNTTIGAGSVVTRDIPPEVLAMGQPCRVSRTL